ncbi:MAG: immunoglobulin-like domain-containing protein, partial [Limisphaerales bacterium]
MKSFAENLGLLTFVTNADGASLTLTRCDVTASGGVEIPAQFAGLTVSAIGGGAFEDCIGLETILIPDTVLSIGDGAFADCSLIQEIIVPASITSVGDGVFAGCSALTSITFGGDAPSLPVSGLLADGASTAVVYVDAYADGFEATYGGLVVSRPDVIAPVLVLEGQPEISHEALTPYLDAGAIATDESDAEVLVTVQGVVDTSILGTYQLTYSAADQAGNQATTVTRLVHVVDTTAPVLSLLGEAEAIHPVSKPFVDPGAVATDLVDGNLEVVVSGTVDVNVLGQYELVYSATDASGNTAQLTRVVTVGDGLAVHSIVATQPVISENGGSTQIKVYLTQPAAERVFLYVEASPINRIRLSSGILSVPAGSREVNFAVTAIDDVFSNGDQSVSVSIKSLYRELGRMELTIRDNEVTNYGIVSDGL